MRIAEKSKLRQEIGMLFQGSALFDSMNVEENIGFPLSMFTKMTAKEIQRELIFVWNVLILLEKISFYRLNVVEVCRRELESQEQFQ